MAATGGGRSLAALANGTVVLVRFPFSDLSGTKLRPAIVLAQAGRGDIILCQITSQPYTDSSAIEVLPTDLDAGSLNRTSYVRPTKLFTANDSIVARQVGQLSADRFHAVIDALVGILESSR